MRKTLYDRLKPEAVSAINKYKEKYPAITDKMEADLMGTAYLFDLKYDTICTLVGVDKLPEAFGIKYFDMFRPNILLQIFEEDES
jgi:hypothetical protein